MRSVIRMLVLCLATSKRNTIKIAGPPLHKQRTEKVSIRGRSILKAILPAELQGFHGDAARVMQEAGRVGLAGIVSQQLIWVAGDDVCNDGARSLASGVAVCQDHNVCLQIEDCM